MHLPHDLWERERLSEIMWSHLYPSQESEGHVIGSPVRTTWKGGKVLPQMNGERGAEQAKIREAEE